MNLDNLNKWLTLTANIGVIAGIAFLAVEIGQQRESIDRANIIAASTAEANLREISTSLNDTIISEPHVAQLYAKLAVDEALVGEE